MCLRGWVLQGTVRTCNASAFEPSAQTARAKQAGDVRNNIMHTPQQLCRARTCHAATVEPSARHAFDDRCRVVPATRFLPANNTSKQVGEVSKTVDTHTSTAGRAGKAGTCIAATAEPSTGPVCTT